MKTFHAAEFYLDTLVTNADGWLVTIPSTSPEHRFKLRDGSTAAVSQGSTMGMSWEHSRLATSQIRSLSGGECEVRHGGKRVSSELKPGEKLTLASDLKRNESK